MQIEAVVDGEWTGVDTTELLASARRHLDRLDALARRQGFRDARHRQRCQMPNVIAASRLAARGQHHRARLVRESIVPMEHLADAEREIADRIEGLGSRIELVLDVDDPPVTHEVDDDLPPPIVLVADVILRNAPPARALPTHSTTEGRAAA